MEVPRGDITAEQLEAIAAIAETRGSGSVRTTQDQNILLRFVKPEELPAVCREPERTSPRTTTRTSDSGPRAGNSPQQSGRIDP